MTQPPAGAEQASSRRTLFQVFLLLVALYVFLVSIQLLGSSFKLFGKDLAHQLLETTAHPLIGLFIGILATSLVQSSSSTTSITVGMVAGGVISVEGAIPIIMGANIGTTVTNTLVSLAQITRREEFRRAVAGATVHDFFNLMLVVTFFPLEVAFKLFSRMSTALGSLFEGVGGLEVASPIKDMSKPAVHLILEIVGDSPVLGVIAALVLMYLALKLLVDLSRVLIAARAELFLHRYVFSSGPAGILAGMVITVLVQSSSITTSMMVPLVGSGVLTVDRVLPFTMGANIGTTCTAILASLAAGTLPGIIVAFSHFLYNALGVLLVYPVPWLRRIPVKLAGLMAEAAYRWRPAVLVYVVTLFFLVPFVLIFLGR